jgi:hypothetical protein
MGTHDDNLARLDKATAKVKRARIALAAAEDEARGVVGDSLKSAVAEGRSRTEVQQRSPFSPPIVRRIGEEAGVPPDERYVRAQTPRGAEPRPADGRTNIDALDLGTVEALARKAEARAIEEGEPGWAARVAASVPKRRVPYAVVTAALIEGYLTESQIPH